jgi:hypothetical protein
MGELPMDSKMIAVEPIRTETLVKAAPARAFEVFATRMGHWWNPAYTINSSPLKDVVIEGKRGGRWLEVGEDGSQRDWGKVLAWEAPRGVVLAWQINPEWAFDPQLVTEVEVRFAADGARATKVELEHRNLDRYGEKAEAMRAALSSPDGWAGLLKRFAEAVAA